MTKGQVISGQFGKIIVRQKSGENLELGELLIAENGNSKILLQVIDLLYGSQISQQNLELISGLDLESSSQFEFMDPKLRNYTLAVLKSLINISKDSARIAKSLPAFFSTVREITKEDIKFLTKPKNPLFVGKLRSGSKTLDVDIFLPGDKVFAHHILIPATTGRGKSLDGGEDVLIEKDGQTYLKTISEIVNDDSNFFGSKALSMNPKNFSSQFKKISKFVKHKAPRFMYKVVSESGREVTVTGDHNLHVMRKGKLMLLKTQQITKNDYMPLPLKIESPSNLKELNIFELLKNEDKIYVHYNPRIPKNLKAKEECLSILSKCYSRPLQKYNDLVVKKNKIKITILQEILKGTFSNEDLKLTRLTDLHNSVTLQALYPLSKEFLELIGYYIAEGYSLNDNSFRISASEKSTQQHLWEIFKKIGLRYFRIKKKGVNVDLGVSSSIFTKILQNIGVGRISSAKRLPNFFMSLSNQKLKYLLSSYFEGDGGVDIKKHDTKRRFKVSATTKSKRLASDLCIALYRFGVLGRCKKRFQRASNSNHQGNEYYRISISGKTEIQSFINKVGFLSRRKKNILRGKLDYKENTNVDLIPLNPVDFKIRREETGLSQKQFSKKLNCSQQIISLIESGKRRPSRSLFNSVLSKFDNFKDLSGLRNFRWDKIKEVRKIRYDKEYVYDLTIDDNRTFLAGHGGLYVHNSNLTSCMLWNTLDQDYCGILVLDPHDEYYGRDSIGLKDHPSRERLVYYTSDDVPVGQRSLKINLELIKPSHFNGVVEWSTPQKEALNVYYKTYGNKWIEAVVLEKTIKGSFNEGTLAVIKRRLLSLLDLEFDGQQLYCNGIFDINAGINTIKDICSDLENSRTVVVDTSGFDGAVEILIGSLIASEILASYKRYKAKNQLKTKPVISIIIEEAPRVLGKEVLEAGSNIFATIAREGRKFKVGLTAITQLPSLIPRQILANMNTKIILGIEMAPERQAIIESASQDLSEDARNIASLDVGEAILSSNFSAFALPVKIPLFEDLVKATPKKQKFETTFEGIG